MKDYREKELKYLYYSLAILMLLLTTDAFNYSTFVPYFEKITKVIECTVLSAIASLFAFLFDCFISSETKDKLIGLFFIPKPGATVFSRIAKDMIHDDRFTIWEAKKQYADIILSLSEDLPDQTKKSKYTYENAAWYKIYSQHKETPAILLLQKDYLLCRDLNVATLLFCVVYLVLCCLFKDTIALSIRFIVILILLLFVSNLSAHQKMNRFVNTVIAVDIAKKGVKQ